MGRPLNDGLALNRKFERLLQHCVVKVHTKDARGSGFFVAPNLILTSEHIIGTEGTLRIEWYGRSADGSRLERPELAKFDMALVVVSPGCKRGHPFASLNPEVQAGDWCYVFGFSDYRPEGDPALIRVDGLVGPMLKLREGQVRPGLSGSPVLNLQTGYVCGLIQSTRDRTSALGGIGQVIRDSELLEINKKYSSEYPFWSRRRLSQLQPVANRNPHLNFAPELSAVSVVRRHHLTGVIAKLSGRAAVAILGVHGQGGIGKTELATGVAHDPRMVDMFPDGIHWCVLGQNPDIHSVLLGLLQQLGDTDYQARALELTASRARAVLRSRRVLLIIDDVWDPKDARHFLTGGACKILFTTRRLEVAESCGAAQYELRQMDESETLKLFEAKLGRELQEAERKDALEIGAMVGFLPLALALISARIARGVVWSELRNALRKRESHFSPFEEPGRRRRGDNRLWECISLSVEALRQEDPEATKYFMLLGSLQEDAEITPAVASTIWDLDQTEARDVLEMLWAESLLRRHSGLVTGAWIYQLHDLLHMYARELSARAVPLGLGMTHRQIHSYILARYGITGTKCSWESLRLDSYMNRALCWHIENSDSLPLLHDLLSATTNKGENFWFRLRQRDRQTAGYLEDIRRASRTTQGDCTEAALLPLGVRYALMFASVKSNTFSLPAPVVAALYRLGYWSLSEVRFYVGQLVNAPAILDCLIFVVPVLPAETQRDIVVAILATLSLHDVAEVRYEGLRRLLGVYEGSLPSWAVTIIDQIHDPDEQARSICLLGSIHADRLGEARLRLEAAATRISEPLSKSRALLSLAEGTPELLLQAFNSALLIEQHERAAEILVECLSRATEPAQESFMPRAMGRILLIQFAYTRLNLLLRLANCLPTRLRPLVIAHAVNAHQLIKSPAHRRQAGIKLSILLEGEQREALLFSLLTEARGIASAEDRLEAFLELAPVIGDGPLIEVINRVGRSQRGGDVSRAISAVAQRLPAGMLVDIKSIAMQLWGADKASALTALLDRFDREEQLTIASTIVELLCSRGTPKVLAQCYPIITRYCNSSQRSELIKRAVFLAIEVQFGAPAAELLDAIAPDLSRGDREELFKACFAPREGVRGETVHFRKYFDLFDTDLQLEGILRDLKSDELYYDQPDFLRRALNGPLLEKVEIKKLVLGQFTNDRILLDNMSTVAKITVSVLKILDFIRYADESAPRAIWRRATLLAELTPVLPGEILQPLLRDVVIELTAIGDRQRQGYVYARYIPFVESLMQKHGIDLIVENCSSDDTKVLLLLVASSLSAEMQEYLIGKEIRWDSDRDRCNFLSLLYPLLKGHARQCASIQWKISRAKANEGFHKVPQRYIGAYELRQLEDLRSLPLIEQVTAATDAQVLREVLNTSTNTERAAVLFNMAEVAAAVNAVGGGQTCAALITEIERVTGWWP